MNNRIFELLAQKGLKMQYLASSIGVKDSKIYDWKRGKTSPEENEIKKIAQILNTSEAYLKGETDDPIPPDTDINLDEFEFALMSEVKELTESQKQEVMRFAKMLKKYEDGQKQ